MSNAAVRPSDYVFAYLRLNSASTGSIEIASTSTVPVRFGYSPPSTIGNVIVERANIYIEDGGVQPTKFGGVNALTNGVVMRVTSSPSTSFSVLQDFTDGEGIKNNKQFGLLAGVDQDLDSGAGADTANVRWTISKAGKPFLLKTGETVECVTQDDLSGLLAFRVMLQGVKESAF